jgi:enoyl-CoA hydratase
MLQRAFPQQKARQVAYTAEKVTPQELYRFGAAMKVVAPGELMAEARKVALDLAAKPPLALRAAKWTANEVELMWTDFEMAYRAIEAPTNNMLLNTEDRKEATRAFAEKRKPVFTGR